MKYVAIDQNIFEAILKTRCAETSKYLFQASYDLTRITDDERQMRRFRNASPPCAVMSYYERNQKPDLDIDHWTIFARSFTILESGSC